MSQTQIQQREQFVHRQNISVSETRKNKKICTKTGLIILILSFLQITIFVINYKDCKLHKRQQDKVHQSIDQMINSLQGMNKQITLRKNIFTNTKIEQIQNKINNIQKQIISYSQKDEQQSISNIDFQKIQLQQLQNSLIFQNLQANMKQILRVKRQSKINQMMASMYIQNNQIKNLIQMLKNNIPTPYMTTIQKRKRISNLGSYNYFIQNHYKLSEKPKQIRLCVVVNTYNNAHELRYVSNLFSILNQNYSNYHLVITDDASTDGTSQLIQQQLHKIQNKLKNITLIKNNIKKGPMNNIHNSILNYCKDNQTIVLVDGDDQLIGYQVFSLISNIYQSKKPIIALFNSFYGKKNTKNQYQYIKTINSNPQFIISKQFRQNIQKINIGFLITFQRSAFLQIQQQNFKINQKFISYGYRYALLVSLFQYACENIQFVPQVTYLYRQDTGNHDYEVNSKKLQLIFKFLKFNKKIPCNKKYSNFFNQ